MAFHDYYAKRRVLVTGHTGFKGGWLCLWLKQLGAEVHGFSLPPPTQPSLHELIVGAAFTSETTGDIRNASTLDDTVRSSRAEIIFHLAAQPLVRRSYADPVGTFTTNAVGTMNVLEAVRKSHAKCTVIVVSSDKCYENRGWDYGYRESDPLGGNDIYSMSKAATELVVNAWRKSFFQIDPALGPIATVRGGNVIGGGDYAPDRIVPDSVRALLEGRPVGVRNPRATRPWQHVLDCLSGYLWLGARLGNKDEAHSLADAFNFGPDARSNRSVVELEQEFLKHWPGKWRDESTLNAPYEAGLLQLSTDKAARHLRWFPTWEFAEAVRETALWYRARHVDGKQDMVRISLEQIEVFTRVAAGKNIDWARSA